MLLACDRMNKWPSVRARRLNGHLFMYVMKHWQISWRGRMVGHLFMWIV